MAVARQQDEIVVFSIVGESVCSECHDELWKGAFLRMEAERPLCLGCADLDHLVFVERGNAALTRRANRYSSLRAVVVRFSRSRGRYERQGVLVEERALARAEQECLSDVEARRSARKRAAIRRDAHEAEYVAMFADRVGELYPGCPVDERRAIAGHACEKYSGRVGRSAASKELDAGAIDLAVRAHVRHTHTRYDDLLASGVGRHEARARIADDVTACLDAWRRVRS